MTAPVDGARDLFVARIEDAIEKCRRGSLARTPFLTPRERREAERILRERQTGGQAWFWGGYAGAERACLFLLPEYLTVCLEDVPQACDPAQVMELLGEEVPAAVSAVRVSGSGYRVFSHRDYLGSVLGLGLERDALGDIAVQNDREAVIFCPRKLSDFLMENLCKVASDTVRCAPYVPDETFTDGRHYRPISATVASARLDCVIAALTGMSREEAQSAVRGGLVEVEFEAVERVDFILVPPLVLSVRGYGRYLLRDFAGETRKGRLRLLADQMV